MSQAPDFSPPIDAGIENEFLMFDFGRILPPGVSIESAAVTCIVSRGKDDAAADRVLGDPILMSSPSTGVLNTAIQQMVGGMVGGCVYVLQAVVQTSDDQSLSLWSRLECLLPA